MERIDLKQARSWCRMLLACLLLAGFAPAAQAGLFTGALAPDNWSTWNATGFVNDGSGPVYYPGGAVFSTGDNPVLTITASGAGTSDTILSATTGTAGYVSFHWTLSANASHGSPQAYFGVEGGPLTPLGPDVTITGSGNVSIWVDAGKQISFELNNTPAKEAGAQMTISEVPEAGNALAGLLVLGAAGFECIRRKRTAGG
jgi:hypothetical protein